MRSLKFLIGANGRTLEKRLKANALTLFLEVFIYTGVIKLS